MKWTLEPIEVCTEHLSMPQAETWCPCLLSLKGAGLLVASLWHNWGKNKLAFQLCVFFFGSGSLAHTLWQPKHPSEHNWGHWQHLRPQRYCQQQQVSSLSNPFLSLFFASFPSTMSFNPLPPVLLIVLHLKSLRLFPVPLLSLFV